MTYSNLLASCNGYTEEQESEYKEKLRQKQDTPRLSQEFCGAKKNDWYEADFTVSPLIENCAEYFTYTGAGEIRARTVEPTKEKAAQETISCLGLNNPNLERSRKNVIQDTLKLIRTQRLSSQQIQKLIQGLDKPDRKGEYVRFCAAILYVLNQQYSVLKKEADL